MKRVVIIGPGGSGKSTLAREIGERLDLPIYHLDQHFWKDDWQIRSAEEKTAILGKIIEEDKWVVDGNFDSTLFKERLARADAMIFLDFPRRINVPRWFKRVIRNWGKPRQDMGGNNVEKFDWDYFKILLGKEHRYPKNELQRLSGNKELFILKSPKQVKDFLAKL